MPFRIALSGLNAAQADLSVTANNIANTSTNGFKGSRAEFADLFAVSLQGVSSNATGNGVRVAAVAQQFAQGNIEFTDSNLDLAVSGPGMFIVSRRRRAGLHARRRLPAESRRLRRELAAAAPAGVSAARGRRLQYRRPRRPAPADHRLAAGGHHQRRIPAEPARRMPRRPPIAPFDPADPNTFNQATSLTLFDSLGATHTGTHVLRQRPPTPTSGTRACTSTAPPSAPAQTLQYSEHRPADRAGRRPACRSRPTRRPPARADMNVTVDMRQSTQYGSNFAVNSVTQDGYTTGRLIGIDIDETGIVQARFTNGRLAAARPDRHRQLRQHAGPAAARQHAVGRDLRLGPGAARPGRQLGLRPGAVRRARRRRTSTSPNSW